jgi:hypothetical protein
MAGPYLSVTDNMGLVPVIRGHVLRNSFMRLGFFI